MIFIRFSPALKFAVTAVLFLFVSSEMQAGASNKSGNPFGNGTFFQTTGTFSAVVRGENLSGTMLFSTGASTNSASTNSSGGSTTIVYQGYVYNGNASGMWDPSGGSISGQFWGGQSLSGSNSQTVYPEMYNTNTFPYAINVVSNTVSQSTVLTGTNGVAYLIPASNVITTNTIYVMPVGQNTYQNSLYMNGSFAGTTQNKYPNQTFTASGSITQQQLYNQDQYIGTTNAIEGVQPKSVTTVTVPVTVQGVRISDSYTSFASVPNAVPYSATAYTMTNIAGF